MRRRFASALEAVRSKLSECRFPMRAEQLCRDHSANCRCEGNSTVHDGHIIVLHHTLLHGHMQGAECSSGTPPAVRRHTRSCAAYSYGTVVSPRRARPNRSKAPNGERALSRCSRPDPLTKVNSRRRLVGFREARRYRNRLRGVNVAAVRSSSDVRDPMAVAHP